MHKIINWQKISNELLLFVNITICSYCMYDKIIGTFFSFPIPASMAFKVRVLLDKISDDQLVFDPLLHNLTHPVTQDLSEVTAHGINKAFRDSELSGEVNDVSVVKFDAVQYTALPIAARDVVSYQ